MKPSEAEIAFVTEEELKRLPEQTDMITMVYGKDFSVESKFASILDTIRDKLGLPVYGPIL
jgi:hypothetical protein